MRKIHAGLLIVCLLAGMLLLPVMGSAETEYTTATLRTRVEVMSGPGDKYGVLPDVTLNQGDRVLVRTKCSPGTTWLQVEFIQSGRSVRGYVRYDDVNADIQDVPSEAPLCTGRIRHQDAVTGAGPYGRGYLTYTTSLRADTTGIIYEVEDGYAHIEYWNYAESKKWRSWISLVDLATDALFSGSGYYGVAEEDSLLVPSPVNTTGTYYGSTEDYPVGVIFTVSAGNCHIKQEADPDTKTVDYAFVGQCYKVLECKTGTTGKDWYLVEVDGEYGWISSGLGYVD